MTEEQKKTLEKAAKAGLSLKEIRVTLATKPNACPKCFGTGKLGYRRAHGVCLRCNGLGLLPSAESKLIAENIRQNRLFLAEIASKPQQTAPDSNDESWLEQLFATAGATG